MEIGIPLPFTLSEEAKKDLTEREIFLFGQGGHSFFHILGCLQVLSSNNLLINKKKWVVSLGSSSLAALVLLTSSSPRSLGIFIQKQFDSINLFRVNYFTFTNLVRSGTVSNHRLIRDLIKTIISYLFNDPANVETFTFLDIFNYTGINFALVANDYQTGKPLIFSHWNTPNTSALDVLVGTFCLPLVWEPSQINDISQRLIGNYILPNNILYELFEPSSRLHLGKIPGIPPDMEIPLITGINTIGLVCVRKNDFEWQTPALGSFFNPLRTLSLLIESAVLGRDYFRGSKNFIYLFVKPGRFSMIDDISFSDMSEFFNSGLGSTIEALRQFETERVFY